MSSKEHTLLSTEIVNRGVEASGPDAGSPTFSIRVRRRLPDFLQSVNLKYVKLGYHYLISHAIYLATIPLLVVVFSAEVGSLSREKLWRKVWDETSYDLATILAFFGVLAFTISVYFMSKPRPIYLIDFSCYKPSDDLKTRKEAALKRERALSYAFSHQLQRSDRNPSPAMDEADGEVASSGEQRPDRWMDRWMASRTSFDNRASSRNRASTDHRDHLIKTLEIDTARPFSYSTPANPRQQQQAPVSRYELIEQARQSGKFDEDSLGFQSRILKSSGIGDETYVPKSIFSSGNCATMKEGRAEASMTIFATLDELFAKTRVRPKDVGVLVVNCSLFNPTPSLSAMIINHYKMRGNILSYNLGGMGCSASVISVDLARDMLQANPNNYAIVVSTEAVSFTWYTGRSRSMLIPNCFFRMGCSAVLLSNRRRDFARAKYKLEHLVRTHKGADDRSFRCVYQQEDEQRIKGLAVSKDILEVGGHALKANITTLGPLVLPFSEQLLFFSTLIYRHFFPKSPRGAASPSAMAMANKPYIPDYKLAFEHFCIHAASKAILDELQKNLDLGDRHLEASRATLHRFGNTSSSSIWYELAYAEAKGRVCAGDRVWQIAFGSGFKCNSAVWKAMRRIRRPAANNPWLDCVDRYPASS